MHPANFSIVRDSPGWLLIKDEGPWDQFGTVTNDVERVVKLLAERLGDRRLYYIDSYGEVDEICVREGRFDGFQAGAPEEWTK